MIDEKRLEELHSIISQKAAPIIAKEKEPYYLFDSYYGECPDAWQSEVEYEGNHYYLDPDIRYSFDGAQKAIEIQKSLGVSFFVMPKDCYCNIDCDHDFACDKCTCEIDQCKCEPKEMNMIHRDDWGESESSDVCPVLGVPLTSSLLDYGIEQEIEHFMTEDGRVSMNRDVEKSDDMYWLYRLLEEIQYNQCQQKKYGEKIMIIAEFAVTDFLVVNWLEN